MVRKEIDLVLKG